MKTNYHQDSRTDDSILVKDGIVWTCKSIALQDRFTLMEFQRTRQSSFNTEWCLWRYAFTCQKQADKALNGPSDL